jgi:hypothetical protein
MMTEGGVGALELVVGRHGRVMDYLQMRSGTAGMTGERARPPLTGLMPRPLPCAMASLALRLAEDAEGVSCISVHK